VGRCVVVRFQAGEQWVSNPQSNRGECTISNFEPDPHGKIRCPTAEFSLSMERRWSSFPYGKLNSSKACLTISHQARSVTSTVRLRSRLGLPNKRWYANLFFVELLTDPLIAEPEADGVTERGRVGPFPVDCSPELVQSGVAVATRKWEK